MRTRLQITARHATSPGSHLHTPSSIPTGAPTGRVTGRAMAAVAAAGNSLEAAISRSGVSRLIFDVAPSRIFSAGQHGRSPYFRHWPPRAGPLPFIEPVCDRPVPGLASQILFYQNSVTAEPPQPNAPLGAVPAGQDFRACNLLHLVFRVSNQPSAQVKCRFNACTSLAPAQSARGSANAPVSLRRSNTPAAADCWANYIQNERVRQSFPEIGRK